MENKFNHFDNEGNAIMVDVGNKNATERIAIASGKIRVNRDTFLAIEQGTAKKGDVLGVARVAGIMAAKKTSELIPLCHPLMITNCTIDFELLPKTLEVEVTSKVKVTGNTGVEMEALTAVSTTLLTIYDMCKAIDKAMEIDNIHLRRKTGGKSGDFINE
ncbi:cyclic pyranopterin monophosphate synthase MoaC [Clostridium botulinum]|uniref:Cyclic pyranopterin monophosphate synthase n=2 Tax=Clostridium botulinum TaxID=1491 RepID=MOAC_CLOBA|nr:MULTISPECIES: cyclic pyranopterin monophosphate synthase MoaC [Clostridium]B2V3T7.1 RecName: Full=Cyclic pyranopterin monophosphate synthase; AltName: Full=Molybdenum cofactor biosynthesis protein C [Clostridium botulinum E3 str. Alaska E43]ACD52355.1 molybdenum cofactor biosynthesis protein C [Clostridium botulinum E3 str. Alaska E43]AJF29115.1 cyclic pyranopterin monophosphate synthase accessory protein [Clostridium botulinum]AJF32176.1 cyclic pyranopterin monophosphate synthase accessory 